MQLVAKLKFCVSEDDKATLLATVRTVNAACDWISGRAFEVKTFRQFALHSLVYAETRSRFSLTAQAAVRAISKVTDSYKLDRRSQRHFRPYGAITYDSRILSFNLPASTVSIWTSEGRKTVPFVCGKRARELLSGRRGESDLCYVAGKFYLFVSCSVETPKPADVADVIGVDCGIVNLATDSDGERFSGEKTDDLRRKYRHRRRNLQRKGTRPARRKLRVVKRRESRFSNDTNHVISKRLVEKAKCTGRGIALEDLSGIRSRVKARRRSRARLHSWAFADLQAKIAYKAALAGIAVFFVDPSKTSQTCPECGHAERANRRSQSEFRCARCGLAGHADTFAARNIRARAVVNLPMVASCA